MHDVGKNSRKKQVLHVLSTCCLVLTAALVLGIEMSTLLAVIAGSCFGLLA